MIDIFMYLQVRDGWKQESIRKQGGIKEDEQQDGSSRR